ncbi:DNA metabolism protein [Lithospermum erythrorhizon]|uniref:DNA metabolism protein n=1 Tax=Lithospermum erythrorhizon TaxID=34254 RepID=A0AAV3R352_LITER
MASQGRCWNRRKVGILTKICLQNFMCHTNLEIELGDHVNFITGLNGSGKSAILGALSVAFGSRPKLTQRANTMKDFIKTGCSYALVHVELKNEGGDAFHPEKYGNRIILERKITESNTSKSLEKLPRFTACFTSFFRLNFLPLTST